MPINVQIYLYLHKYFLKMPSANNIKLNVYYFWIFHRKVSEILIFYAFWDLTLKTKRMYIKIIVVL